jgi:glycosyltransferase involved in cell wall biosynthesis
MKIAIATIFYNNHDELARLVQSIPDKVVDYWIAVDGPFKYNLDTNPELPHHSDDGSIEVITESRNKFNYGVVVHYKPGATEFDKRNLYLENCKKLGIDVLLIIDSDEYFIYDQQEGKSPKDCWLRLRKNIELEMIKNPHHNVYGIRTFDQKHNMESYCPRIWVKPHQMRYVYGSHYHYANIETEQQDIDNFKKYRQCYTQHAASVIKGGVTLTHDYNLRSEEYQQRRKQYQQYLVRYEELTQSHKFTPEECDRMAKENPATGFDPT